MKVCITHNINFLSLEKPQLLTDNYEETHFIAIKKYPVGSCGGSPVNQSVALNCRANNYQEIRWYKNGELLDLSSEETTYNQTSGELVIRREDACELLGVYQCFASNDVDTVHASTRVLPFGKEAPSNTVTELLECFNRLAKPSRKAGATLSQQPPEWVCTRHQIISA